MVMNMSRVAAKKMNRKRKKSVFFVMIFIFTMLTVGLLMVDGAHREMMARHNEVRVLGYYREGKYHVLQVIGEEYYVDQEVVVETIEAYLFKSREKIMIFIDYIKGII